MNFFAIRGLALLCCAAALAFGLAFVGLISALGMTWGSILFFVLMTGVLAGIIKASR